MQLPLPLPDFFEDQVLGDVPRPRRVYVNRNLRFDLVSLVGFDMDYTLAIYRQSEMDRLSIEATADKLVGLGYPERLRQMELRTDFPIRGLLIDRKLGNVLKMDRYRYVKKAYRGLRELTREERHKLYHSRPIRRGSARFHWVDTLYALSEVSLFAAAVEELERSGYDFEPGQLFDDIRSSIDLAHQDGSIVDAIMREPERFMRRDVDLCPTFHKLKSSGKRLFLLTNSSATFTDFVMGWTFKDALNGYSSWRSFFDIIVSSAKKPAFFVDTKRAFEPAEPGLEAPGDGFEPGRIYQGGCLEEFQALAKVAGDEVLYVGDHIYGDVLHAKKSTAWRTAMIIQEMDRELRVHSEIGALIEEIDQREAVRDILHEELRHRLMVLRDLEKRLAVFRSQEEAPSNELSAGRVHHRRMVERLRTRLVDLDRELEDLEFAVDRAFHPFWGSLFKAGSEVSSFGDQVEQYACLYTDRVSNLLRYSPLHYFRSPRDRMPHELFDSR